MKLIFLLVATILLCSVLIEARPQPRRRVIRIRIIRIIPIRRRGRRDVDSAAAALSSASTEANSSQDVSMPDYSLLGGDAVSSADEQLTFTNADAVDSLPDVDFAKVRDALQHSLQAHHLDNNAEVEVELQSSWADASTDSHANAATNDAVYETVWSEPKVVEA